MLRIGKGNGQILLSCQSDRKQAKHLIMYKRLYKGEFCIISLHRIYRTNFAKPIDIWPKMSIISIVESATRKHSRDARQARKRTTGKPLGYDDRQYLDNYIMFGKRQGIMCL